MGGTSRRAAASARLGCNAPRSPQDPQSKMHEDRNKETNADGQPPILGDFLSLQGSHLQSKQPDTVCVQQPWRYSASCCNWVGTRLSTPAKTCSYQQVQ